MQIILAQHIQNVSIFFTLTGFDFDPLRLGQNGLFVSGQFSLLPVQNNSWKGKKSFPDILENKTWLPPTAKPRLSLIPA
jgi:hypothetical protein